MKNQVFQNIKLINSALLFPAVNNESCAIKRTHGAYYSDGSVIEECLVIRRYGTTGKEPLKSSFVKEFDRHSFKHLPTAVYGGPLFKGL